MRNEQARDGGCFQASPHRRPVAMFTVRALVALAACFFCPAPAGALPHANDPINAYWGSVEPGGSGCSGCHTLNNCEGVPSTSYIKASARTYPDMKAANGGVDVTGNLGCTFCHNRGTAASKMKGALIHFNGLRSQHPVGRKFTGASAYHDTQGEYLSSYGSNTPEEMDCLDCHDESLIAPGGYYMVHADPPANNPYHAQERHRRRPVRRTLPLLPRRLGGRRLEIEGQGHPGDLPPRRAGCRECLVGDRRDAAADERPGQRRDGERPDEPVRGLPRAALLGEREALRERLQRRHELHGVSPRGRPVRQLHEARPRQDAT